MEITRLLICLEKQPIGKAKQKCVCCFEELLQQNCRWGRSVAMPGNHLTPYDLLQEVGLASFRLSMQQFMVQHI